jgi:hypothetical protein
VRERTGLLSALAMSAPALTAARQAALGQAA